MRSATKRAGLQGCAQIGFLVLFMIPLLVLSVTTELPGSMKTATLVHPADATGLSPQENLLMCSPMRVWESNKLKFIFYSTEHYHWCLSRASDPYVSILSLNLSSNPPGRWHSCCGYRPPTNKPGANCFTLNLFFFFKFCIHPSEPPKWKGRKISTVGEVVEQPTGTLTHFWWECKRMQPLWQTA